MSGIPRRDFMCSTLVAAGAVALTGAMGDAAFAFAAGTGSSDREADRAADRIIDRVKRPRIPQRDFPITRFGAVGDGVTDNSAAIAAAVQEAASHGGGRVVINYGEGNTGSYPPVVTDINLSHWTVATATQGWNIAGYPSDPVGTIRPRDLTITGPIATANVATNVSDLTLTDVTIDGAPQ